MHILFFMSKIKLYLRSAEMKQQHYRGKGCIIQIYPMRERKEVKHSPSIPHQINENKKYTASSNHTQGSGKNKSKAG